jgi:hypothetical protein
MNIPTGMSPCRVTDPSAASHGRKVESVRKGKRSKEGKILAP